MQSKARFKIVTSPIEKAGLAVVPCIIKKDNPVKLCPFLPILTYYIMEHSQAHDVTNWLDQDLK